ncbi:hypothetical protein LM592_04600, partial [Candidatus Acetothermia bacterium]|nr:hypothetical protein [Candidatus Acetothermia bacterium]
VSGLQSGAFSTGQATGPLGFGLIADLGGVNSVFPFGGVVGLVGSIFVLLWLRRWQTAADIAAGTIATVSKESAVEFGGNSEGEKPH